ncbi:hypothetical protein [Microbispora hainanensis]|nr:hypothetical protein [Microbispora hainanensis]
MRLVNATTTCKPTETKVSWNRTGPQGPVGIGGTGPKGDAGAQGPRGFRGPQGLRGPAGPQGPQGPKGAAGAPGKDGAPGKGGAPGKDGKDGERGPAGPQGPKGDPGKDGVAGITVKQKEFSFGLSSKSVTLSCGGGYATGGGYRGTSIIGEVLTNGPVLDGNGMPTGWEIKGSIGTKGTAYVICASVGGGGGGGSSFAGVSEAGGSRGGDK